MRPTLRLPALLAAALLAAAAAAGAQAQATKPVPVAPGPAQASTHDEGTLEVTADRDLEWLQNEKAYVARGNAVAKRGTVTLMADTLIAYYRPLKTPATPVREKEAHPGAVQQGGFDSGNTEIWRVVAEGNVHLISEDKDAWGDHAEYDKDKSVTVLTGKALKGTTLEDTVTARDSLEYWQDKDMAVARGNAKIVKVNGDTLEGDLIGGHFEKDSHGTSVLKTIESKGNVVITTATDIVHGDEGVYELAAKRTVLFGNVIATNGGNVIKGASAEVNMDTGISHVFPGTNQKVIAVFKRQSTPSDSTQKSASGEKH
ncbi:MAG TPA: LptA/OstA family protein [Alphaproteobacteria bacterium]|nr:LptA/OstA family protein [Alphaproteobacteria bacterium]